MKVLQSNNFREDIWKKILFGEILKLKSSKYLDATYEILISVFID